MRKIDAFKSQYLRTADLKGQERTFTIDSVVLEEILSPDGGDSEEKPVVSFRDHSQRMILNSTNWDAIAEIYGDETDGWVGQRVTIYPTTTQFGSRRVECMRIKAPKALEPASASSSNEPPPLTDADQPPEPVAEEPRF